MSLQQIMLCRYHYDPLNRIASVAPAAEDDLQRFYRKNRLATEIQGALQRSVFQYEDQVLAQQQRSGATVEAALIATDQQRSVLKLLTGGQPVALSYTVYGHHPVDSGLSSLLGFAGEQRDPVTGHYILGRGYRAFNPELMRFNSPDNFSPFGEGGVNAYMYCAGDPVNGRDPTGHIPISVSSRHPKSLIRRINLKQPRVVLERLPQKTIEKWTSNQKAPTAIASPSVARFSRANAVAATDHVATSQLASGSTANPGTSTMRNSSGILHPRKTQSSVMDHYSAALTWEKDQLLSIKPSIFQEDTYDFTHSDRFSAINKQIRRLKKARGRNDDRSMTTDEVLTAIEVMMDTDALFGENSAISFGLQGDPTWLPEK